MAASKQLSQSIRISSERALNRSCSARLFGNVKRESTHVAFPCSICKTGNTESTHYCANCDSNMCQFHTDAHAGFPNMALHLVVDISEQQKAPLPTEHCDEHGGKTLNKYCQDHDQVICETCASDYHERCMHVKHLPTLARGISKGQEFGTVIKSTQTLMTELERKKSSKSDLFQNYVKAETQCQRALRDLVTSSKTHIDKLAKAESDKITSTYQKEKDALKRDIQAIEEQEKETKSTLERLEGYKGNNESDLFVYIKQSKKVERQANEVLQSMRRTDRVLMKFKMNTTILRSVKVVKSFVEFEMPAITANLHEEVSVKVPRDVNDCSVTGACFLPDASILIVDFDNNRLKHLDHSYKVISCLNMPGPWDACYTNRSKEVAVTLTDDQRVQFVSVRNTMRAGGSFRVKDTCAGVCFSNDELFICEGFNTGACVRVYSLTGLHLRTLQQGPTGQRMFAKIRYITVNASGNKFHVTDVNNGVLTIDRGGELLATFKDHGLRGANGLCTLENNDLMVCGFESNNILHISEDGKKLGVVLNEKDGIVKPRVVFYDPVNARLIVFLPKKNIAKIYNIQ